MTYSNSFTLLSQRMNSYCVFFFNRHATNCFFSKILIVSTECYTREIPAVQWALFLKKFINVSKQIPLSNSVTSTFSKRGD